MTARVFVDTNVFVYVRDATEPDKQSRAAEWLAALWRARAGRTSVQVLNEFYVTTTQKLAPGLDRALARQDVKSLLAWQPEALDARVTEAAFIEQDAFRLSFWDALIVAAARKAGCTHLLSEDLHDGQDLGKLVVVNPFAHLPVDIGV